MAQMSFLPEDYLERKLQRRTNIVCVTLFAIVMVGVIAAFYISDRERRDAFAQQKQVNEQCEVAAKRLEQLEQLQQRKQRMIQKARVTSTLLERVPRSVILAELINNMPVTMTLVQLDMETRVVQNRAKPKTALDAAKREMAAKAVSPEESEPEAPTLDVLMQVQGVAPTDMQVAQFMTAITKSPLFSEVNLAFSEEVSSPQHVERKFRVDLKLNPALDPTQLKPTMVRRELLQNPMSPRMNLGPEGPSAALTGAEPIMPANHQRSSNAGGKD